VKRRERVRKQVAKRRKAELTNFSGSKETSDRLTTLVDDLSFRVTFETSHRV
jgi:hypothetical protein